VDWNVIYIPTDITQATFPGKSDRKWKTIQTVHSKTMKITHWCNKVYPDAQYISQTARQLA